METKIFSVFLASLVLIFISCKKDKDEATVTPTSVTTDINKYLASGSYGDVIRYEVNKTTNMYKYYNETTGQSDSGSFIVSTNSNLSGVYEVNIGGSNFYAIELAEKAFATSMPSGRTENAICFGLSSDLDLSADYSASDLSGKYLFIIYDDMTSSEIWGGYDIKEDGTYTWQWGPQDENNFNENIHFAGGGSGTWAISPGDHSKIIFTEGGINYTGTIYPDKAMLIDNGIGNGFTLGIKYPAASVSQASIGGTYRYLDVTVDGYQGIGYYTLPASGGNVNYYYKYNTTSITEGTGTCSDFTEISAVKNMFKCSDVVGTETLTTWFIILPGEVMLHFSAGNNGLVSYGIGAKIN